MTNLELAKAANRVRKGIVSSVHSAKAGHPGGSLSAADIYTFLYFEEMNVDPQNPKDPDRDRFVLSKGHTAPGYYSTLANRGFFPVEDLLTLRKLGSYLQGHPDMKHIPGVDMSSGSLGQGISAAVGMALAGKMDKRDYRVYTVMGDGELAEGSVWEGAMAAGHYKLDNLCAVIDRNRLQISGSTEDVMHHDSLIDRWSAFGWHVINVENGNNIDELNAAFDEAKQTKGMPSLVLANTVKGYGSKVMENVASWHHHVPSEEEAKQIFADFEARREAAL